MNRIRSSILNTKKNFLQCQTLSVDGTGIQTSSESTPSKIKNKTKLKQKVEKVSTIASETAGSSVKSAKKKKKVGKSNKVSTNSAQGKKKDVSETKVEFQNTPFKTRTFYKKAGNITKLEVFLHQDVKKKKKKKAELVTTN